MILTDFIFLLCFLQSFSYGVIPRRSTERSDNERNETDTSETNSQPDTGGKISLSTLGLGVKKVVTTAAHAFDETISEPLVTLLGLNMKINCVKPPLECPNENITFWYYPRPDVNESVQISVSDPQTFEKIEKNDRTWKVIFHGYTKSKNEIPNPQLREAYQIQGKEYNILSLDYEPIARKGCYLQAVENVALISKCSAQILDELIEKGYMKLENLHVIGFSLGAQIAGRLYEYMRNGRPPRVTALDPAAPFFDGKRNERVSTKAGDFVEIIHTNTMSYGMAEATGHIDFYINGGLVQPGCNATNPIALTQCSHDRAPLVYAESINSEKGFWGFPCKSKLKFYAGGCNSNEEDTVIMGEYTPHTARGTYYVKTRDEPPYAMGKTNRTSDDV